MISWIFENGILNYLTGEGLHEELLRRSIKVFTFLAKEDKLDQNMIHHLWESCMVRPERKRELDLFF